MLPCHRDLGMLLLTLALVTSALYYEVFGSQSAAIVTESPSLRKERLILRQEMDSSVFFFSTPDFSE